MDSLQHVRSVIECSWSWLCEFVDQNKLTASLIATNAALMVRLLEEHKKHETTE